MGPVGQVCTQSPHVCVSFGDWTWPWSGKPYQSAWASDILGAVAGCVSGRQAVPPHVLSPSPSTGNRHPSHPVATCPPFGSFRWHFLRVVSGVRQGHAVATGANHHCGQFDRGENIATTAKADIVAVVQEQAGISRQQSTDVVEAVFATVSQRLEQGESVKLSGFGVFSVRAKRVRRGRNPRTGEPIEVSARSVLSFKSSVILRKRVATPIS